MAMTDPQARTRAIWGSVAAVVALVAAAVVLSTNGNDSTVKANPSNTSVGPANPSTTGERIRSTTSTDAGAVEPEPPAIPGAIAVRPAVTGGLTTFGLGVFSIDTLLATLSVAPAGPETGYERSLFDHWIDADGNGCDTRGEVLRAESITPAQIDPVGCFVLTGDWLSIYDNYTTDDPSELDVDHMVPLFEAWQSGASTWSAERRRAFANDLDHPGTLVAVTQATNRSKGADDPAQWQPPNRNAWCMYAADWITVKARWQLTADAAEISALRNMLRGCGTGAAAPAGLPVPAPVPIPVPAPAPTAAPTAAGGGCDPSYPTVCIPPAPPDLDCGDITFRRFMVRPPDPHRFDGRDNDGIGCES